jgi:hypothetical protein
MVIVSCSLRIPKHTPDSRVSRPLTITLQPRGLREHQYTRTPFNAFNHVQYADPAVAYGMSSLGSIQSSSVAPRIIQPAAKIQF